jgi:hypothetical protein
MIFKDYAVCVTSNLCKEFQSLDGCKACDMLTKSPLFSRVTCTQQLVGNIMTQLAIIVEEFLMITENLEES